MKTVKSLLTEWGMNEVTKANYTIAKDPYALKIAKLMEHCQREMSLGSHVFRHEPRLNRAFDDFISAQQELADLLQELTGHGVL